MKYQVLTLFLHLGLILARQSIEIILNCGLINLYKEKLVVHSISIKHALRSNLKVDESFKTQP